MSHLSELVNESNLNFLLNFVKGSVSLDINKFKIKNSKVINKVLAYLFEIHYKDQLKSQISNLIASADLIGNPR